MHAMANSETATKIAWFQQTRKKLRRMVYNAKMWIKATLKPTCVTASGVLKGYKWRWTVLELSSSTISLKMKNLLKLGKQSNMLKKDNADFLIDYQEMVTNTIKYSSILQLISAQQETHLHQELFICSILADNKTWMFQHLGHTRKLDIAFKRTNFWNWQYICG